MVNAASVRKIVQPRVFLCVFGYFLAFHRARAILFNCSNCLFISSSRKCFFFRLLVSLFFRKCAFIQSLVVCPFSGSLILSTTPYSSKARGAQGEEEKREMMPLVQLSGLQRASLKRLVLQTCSQPPIIFQRIQIIKEFFRIGS
jgi:hypothetical protein